MPSLHKDISHISSWPRNQSNLTKQAHSLQFALSSLPINRSVILSIQHTKATPILAFSFSPSCLLFSQVLWQEESNSSNQSFSYENKLSNTSQGFIRSDPSKHLEHLWKWRNTMFTFNLEPSQLESCRTFQRVSKRSKHSNTFLGVQ